MIEAKARWHIIKSLIFSLILNSITPFIHYSILRKVKNLTKLLFILLIQKFRKLFIVIYMLDSNFDDDDSVQFTAGSVIYSHNDESDCAYFLKKGEVEIISEKGTTVGFINEEEVFGEQSILLETKRTVTAKASTDCLAIKIPKNTLLSEYKKSSPLIKAILRSTCIRLTNLDNSIHTSLKSEDD